MNIKNYGLFSNIDEYKIDEILPPINQQDLFMFNFKEILDSYKVCEQSLEIGKFTKKDVSTITNLKIKKRVAVLLVTELKMIGMIHRVQSCYDLFLRLERYLEASPFQEHIQEHITFRRAANGNKVFATTLHFEDHLLESLSKEALFTYISTFLAKKGRSFTDLDNNKNDVLAEMDKNKIDVLYKTIKKFDKPEEQKFLNFLLLYKRRLHLDNICRDQIDEFMTLNTKLSEYTFDEKKEYAPISVLANKLLFDFFMEHTLLQENNKVFFYSKEHLRNVYIFSQRFFFLLNNSTEFDYIKNQIDCSYNLFIKFNKPHKKSIFYYDYFYQRELEEAKIVNKTADEWIESIIEDNQQTKKNINTKKSSPVLLTKFKNNTNNDEELLHKKREQGEIESTAIKSVDPIQSKIIRMMNGDYPFKIAKRILRYRFKNTIGEEDYIKVRNYRHGGELIHKDKSIQDLHFSIIAHGFPPVEMIMSDPELAAKFVRVDVNGFTMIGVLEYIEPISQATIRMEGVFQFGLITNENSTKPCLIHRFFVPFERNITSINQAIEFSLPTETDIFYDTEDKNEVLYDNQRVTYNLEDGTFSIYNQELQVKVILYHQN